MKPRDTSPVIGKAGGENAARALRLIKGHHQTAGVGTYVDRLAPAARDAVEARQRSAGSVTAPLDAKREPEPAPDHEATLSTMLADLGELGQALDEAACGRDVNVSALRLVADVAFGRWQSIRDALGEAHPLSRRARSVQIYTTALATDWIPSLVIAHRQSTRGLP